MSTTDSAIAATEFATALPEFSGVDAEVWSFTVAKVSGDMYEGVLHDGREAIVPNSEVPASLRIQIGVSFPVTVMLDGARPVMSAARAELVAALYAGVAPEVRSGDVRIVAVARIPGVRSKVAVAATRDGIDPVAACVGREASRVTYISKMLGAERIDVVPYHQDLHIFVANCMAPAAVTSVAVKDGRIEVSVPAHQMSAAVGGGGLNSHLAGELVGYPIDVVQAPSRAE
jgi:N utilization substance protein A